MYYAFIELFTNRMKVKVKHLQRFFSSDASGGIVLIIAAALAMVMNCLASNLDTMDGYAERLGIAADNYDEADHAASQRMTAIHSGYGPNLPL